MGGRKRVGKGFIYFAQVQSGPIKIGYTEKSIQQRLSCLRTGHYEELKLLGSVVGTFDDEQRLHRLVGSSKIRGEWFYPSTEVLALVAKTLADFEAIEVDSCTDDVGDGINHSHLAHLIGIRVRGTRKA